MFTPADNLASSGDWFAVEIDGYITLLDLELLHRRDPDRYLTLTSS